MIEVHTRVLSRSGEFLRYGPTLEVEDVASMEDLQQHVIKALVAHPAMQDCGPGLLIECGVDPAVAALLEATNLKAC